MHHTLSKVAIILSVLFALNAHAQRCEKAVANLESLEGKGSYKSQTQDTWAPVTVGFKFCYGDTLRIEEFRAALRLENETLVRLNEGSVVRFVPPKKSFWLELVDGAAHFISRTPKKFTVKMPYLNAGVDGTEFVVQHEEDKDTVAVFEGLVTVANEVDQIQLAKLEQVSGTADSSLQNKIKISIEGAVDWALRYPPTLLHYSAIPDIVYQKIQNNNIDAAITELEDLDPNAGLFHAQLLQVSLYLHQGKISKAKTALNNAQALDAQANDLKALQALITLIEGDSQRALTQSQAIIDSGALSPLTLLVHSYTLQANFKLEEALDFAEQAAEKQANSYVIWNRVAELALNTNYVKKAEKALDKASRLNSNNADTLTLQGFIQLKKYKFKTAKKYFEQAITIDNDSFANFALGLVTIRLGDLEKGRELIELAVILDPNNSLYRSYLGKAYADEYRFEDAQEQYELAKNLDPNDPTPYFYQAMLYQSQNLHKSAIEAFEESKQRNEGRLVQRSKVTVTGDQITRDFSKAKSLKTLGFLKSATISGSEAIALAPTEYAGHRNLAEIYSISSDHESLRAIESFQAKVMQPIGARPIPLGTSETQMRVLANAEPSTLGTSEFGQLYQSDGVKAESSFIGGSQGLRSSENTIYGSKQNIGFQMSHFGYKSDGFRPNNAVDYEISNALGQWQATDDLSFQVELRKSESEEGDLHLQFDLNNFSEFRKITEEKKRARVGANIQLSPREKVVINKLKNSSDSQVSDQFVFEDFSFPTKTYIEINSEQSDFAYFYNSDRFNLNIGYSDSHFDVQTDDDGGFAASDVRQDMKEFHFSVNSSMKNTLKLSTGINFLNWNKINEYPDLTVEIDNTTRLLPKIGLEYSPLKNSRIRLIHSKSVSFNIDHNTSLKPSHVAGYPQFHEFINGTLVVQNGIGFTFEPSQSVKIGAQATDYKIRLPLANASKNLSNDVDRQVIQSNLDLIVSNKTTATLEVTHEEISREISNNTVSTLPLKYKKQHLDVNLNYFLTDKILYQINLNYLKQSFDAMSSATSLPITFSDSFATVDSTVEYKLPIYKIIFKLGVLNLLDEKFQLADFNVFTFSPRQQQYAPERTVYFGASLFLD